MACRISFACVAVLSVGLQVIAAQQVPLVQPGAPGQPNKVVTNTVGTAVKDPTAADFSFMQDMMMHHSQAVEMVSLMKGRTSNPDLLDLGKRISISQGDEIAFMKRWLAFYGKPVQDGGSMAGMDMDHGSMQGMDHSHADMKMDTPMMPGICPAC